MNIYLMKKPKRLNAVSITLGLIGLAIAYVIWFLVPAFWPVFQLTGIMKGACNAAYREFNDEKVINQMLRDAQRTHLKISKDNFRLTRVPYEPEELSALTHDENAANMFRARGKECVLELIYQDDYEWPLIGKKTNFTFERTVRTDMATLKWEKGCTCVTTSHR